MNSFRGKEQYHNVPAFYPQTQKVTSLTTHKLQFKDKFDK